MELKDIILCETNQQRKANSMSSHLYVDDKNAKVIQSKNRMMVARAWEVDRRGRCWSNF